MSIFIFHPFISFIFNLKALIFFSKGELLAVIGAVGSGKVSLLLCESDEDFYPKILLYELVVSEKNLKIHAIVIFHLQSSLLMSILGELPLTEGQITVRGKIGYASQQAWIYNSSLQQNIIFGSEYDESRYSEVIKACALQKVCMLFIHNKFCTIVYF